VECHRGFTHFPFICCWRRLHFELWHLLPPVLRVFVSISQSPVEPFAGPSSKPEFAGPWSLTCISFPVSSPQPCFSWRMRDFPFRPAIERAFLSCHISVTPMGAFSCFFFEPGAPTPTPKTSQTSFFSFLFKPFIPSEYPLVQRATYVPSFLPPPPSFLNLPSLASISPREALCSPFYVFQHKNLL